MRQIVIHSAALIILLLITPAAMSQDYDFAATTPSGHTLYYIIVGQNACVVSGPSIWRPSGNLIIPSTATDYNGNSYTVTTITSWAFKNCNELTSVVIPNSVTTIAREAFHTCSALVSVTIPNGVHTIGSGAFQFCSSLASVTIPNSVISLDRRAFYGCTNLTSATIGDGVASIAEEIFYNCSNLSSITIPSSATIIKKKAFYGCSSLQNATIPNSVVTIEDSAFANCGLTAINIPDSVVTIGYSAFSYCNDLHSVTIGKNVANLGRWSFAYCPNLTSVLFNAINCTWNSGGSSNFRPFDGCNNIAYFTFGNEVTRIPPYLCYGMIALTSITIPNSVTTIGVGSFHSCENLHFVSIGTGVTSMENAFYSGSMSNITSVEYNAINCTTSYINCPFGWIKNITFGNEVSRIPQGLCRNNDSLTSVTIPSSVTHIGGAAFDGCHNLDSVFLMPQNPPTLGNGLSGVFSMNSYRRVFVLPNCSYYDTYSSCWPGYSSYFRYPSYDIAINVCSNDTLKGSASVIPLRDHDVRCDSSAVIEATANNGYHFDHWSNGSTNNPDTVQLISDTTIIAYFVSDGDTATPTAPINTYIRTQMSLRSDIIGKTVFNRMFIPDCPFYYGGYPLEFPLEINEFSAEDIITSPDDIRSVCVTMEHSYPRDLYISVVCPTGQQAFLKYGNASYGDSITGLSRDSISSILAITSHGGGRYLGMPLNNLYGRPDIPWDNGGVTGHPCDSLYNPFGTGATYCFSRNSNYTLVTGDNAGEVWTESMTIPAGNYYVSSNGYSDTVDATYETIPEYFLYRGGVTPPNDTIVIKHPSNRETRQGYYLPTSTFDELVGCPLNGTWKLKVYDVQAGDNGYVFDWSIDFRNIFVGESDAPIHDTLWINDTVTIHDTLRINDTVTIHDTLWINDTITIYDTIYINTENIGDVQALNAKVYSSQGQVVVEGAEGNDVRLFDITGRRIQAIKQSDNQAIIRFDAPASGTYMVKIGNYPARKVVVIR